MNAASVDELTGKLMTHTQVRVADYTIMRKWKLLFVNSTTTELVAKVGSHISVVGGIS